MPWQPMCGEMYPQERVAGDPIVCDKDWHPDTEKHKHCETGFEWW